MLKIVIPLLLMMTAKKMTRTAALSTMALVLVVAPQTLNTSKMSYIFMGDAVSYWMINLSMWIMMIVAAMKSNSHSMFTKLGAALMIILIGTFFTWDLMIFYMFFEMSMIIIIITTMVWGYQPERVEAAMYMMMMTTVFSLPFFMFIMSNSMTTNFWYLPHSTSLWEYASIILIFMVKMPVYILHIWLPKLHVESPVQGSMILASIMLKLGCYGMIRITKLITKPNMTMMWMIMSFAMWSMIIMSMICTIQTDIKMMIAYSSVVHMMLTLIGINMAKTKTTTASIIIMMGHGMCSSGLFFLCNQMYKVTKSRSIIINRGICTLAPTAVTMWFFLCMLNAPMPPSINIVGELMTFKLIMEWSWLNYTPAFFVMMVSSCYSILMYCIPSHGKCSKSTYKPMDLNSKSMIIINMHIMPTIMLIAKISMIAAV